MKAKWMRTRFRPSLNCKPASGSFLEFAAIRVAVNALRLERAVKLIIFLSMSFIAFDANYRIMAMAAEATLMAE
jgi:hypothetical protein